MKRIVYPISLIILFSLLLSSCLPLPVSAEGSTPNASTVQAVIVQTVVANFNQQTAGAPTGTLTPSPSETLTETPTATPTTTPTSTRVVFVPVIPCYRAAFIADVTVLDGTQFAPGANFTKAWRLQNTGSCLWTTDFQVLFDHGDLLGAPSSFNLPDFVNPGQTIDLSVDMTAPDNTGDYQGFWKLEASNGTIFGVGSPNMDFDAQIAVGNTPVPFEVREIDLSVSDTEITTSCPPGNRFTITAVIRTNGTGDVVYFWEFSDGTQSDDHTITFDDSRRRTVSTTFSADHSGDFWARLRIEQPNDMRSDKISFSLNCQTPTPENTLPPTSTPTPTHTLTPRNTRTPTPSRTPTPTDTLTPTLSPSLTLSVTETDQPGSEDS